MFVGRAWHDSCKNKFLWVIKGQVKHTCIHIQCAAHVHVRTGSPFYYGGGIYMYYRYVLICVHVHVHVGLVTCLLEVPNQQACTQW